MVCGSLVKGCKKRETDSCQDHGLQLDGDGKCAHVPANVKGSKVDLGRLNIKKYYVRETGDIILVRNGEGIPEDGPPVFDVMKDTRFKYGHIDDRWKGHYSSAIENQLDVSHLAFVLHNTIGKANKTLHNGPTHERKPCDGRLADNGILETQGRVAGDYSIADKK